MRNGGIVAEAPSNSGGIATEFDQCISLAEADGAGDPERHFTSNDECLAFPSQGQRHHATVQLSLVALERPERLSETRVHVNVILRQTREQRVALLFK